MKKIDYIGDVDTWRNTFTFSIPITIRFSETDMFGHMNNISPFIYFEQARIEFMKTAGLLLGSSDDSSGVPVVGDLQCDYLRQLYFDDNIDVYVKAESIGTTSVELHYMVVNEQQELCLTGRGRLVFIHADTGKPAPLNVDLKNHLKSL